VLGGQVLAFPFAGGTRWSYRSISERLEEPGRWNTIELPGRGARTAQRPVLTVDEAVRDLTVHATRCNPSAPTVLFGHSMGALMAFLVAVRLTELGTPPRHLVVSGRAAPNRISRAELPVLDDAALVRELRTMGGLPEEIRSSQKFLDYWLPILRADLAILDDWRAGYVSHDSLETPITVLRGIHDVTADDAAAWRAHTRGSFSVVDYDGGHFFLDSHAANVAQLIQAMIAA